MGLLDLSPGKVRIVRDVAILAIVGYFFTIGIAYHITALRDALFIFR